MERRRAEETESEYEQLRRDWMIGSEQFRQELLAAMSKSIGPNHFGQERKETAEQKAERLIESELQRFGWTEDSLSVLPKGHPRKLGLARRLRTETEMSLKWIAQRLHMGRWTYVSNLLRCEPKPAQFGDAEQSLLPLCQ